MVYLINAAAPLGAAQDYVAIPTLLPWAFAIAEICHSYRWDDP